MNTTILIPAYNPNIELTGLVKKITSDGLFNVLVIDDGSNNDYDFSSIALLKNVNVISHEENMGKGVALKSGIKYLSTKTKTEYILTADADGQHLPDDILKCANNAEADKIVLGTRRFENDIPMRSSFGNKVTKYIFNKITRSNLQDTQTGLRVIPRKYFDHLLSIPGDRYEYETNMLLSLIEIGVKIKQVEIKAVYFENNESSHFRPIIDSILIYSSFLRFAASGLISFIIDILLFNLLLTNGFTILHSTYGARSVSTLLNFSINRKFAFNKRYSRGVAKHLIGYLSLVLFIATLSGSMVGVLYELLNYNIVLTKIFVDGLLFFVSFYFQKFFIFKK